MFALAPKWCNATPRSVLYGRSEHSTLVFYLSLLFKPVRQKQQWQMYGTKRWMPESERIWHSDTWGERLDGFSLCSILYCIVSVSCKTQHPTDAITTLMRQKADWDKNSDNQIFYSCSPGDESIWLWWSDFSLAPTWRGYFWSFNQIGLNFRMDCHEIGNKPSKLIGQTPTINTSIYHPFLLYV